MHNVAMIVVTPLILLSSFQRASAANTNALERAAKKACLAGDTAKGVEILAELYVNTNDITWIFNQGRCFEQNRRYEDAIGRFREYLVKGGKRLPAAHRALAEGHIEICHSYLPKVEQRSVEVPKPKPVAPLVQTQVPLPQTPATSVRRSSPVTTSRQGGGWRVAGLIVGTVGVASLGTAVTLNLKANNMAADLNQPTGYDRDRVSRRSSFEALSWVGYGVGSAFLLGGAILYYLGHRSDSSPAVTLAPTAAPGMAGVNLQGAF